VNDPGIEKRYRSYLTRLSKHEAIYAGQKNEAVGVQALRDSLVKKGEVREFLDDAWAKKVFGDLKIFESNGDGFYQLTNEAGEIELGKRPTWKGQRPGDDWVRGAYDNIVSSIDEMSLSEVIGGTRCLSGEWRETASATISALEDLKRRGIERPLEKLWEVAWDESLKTSISESVTVHQVALWLTTTMGDTDAFVRLRAYMRDGTQPRPWDVIGVEDGQVTAYVPTTVRASLNDAKALIAEPPDLSPRGVLESIHGRLVYRGVMKEKA
jgi:hypothetical protein